MARTSHLNQLLEYIMKTTLIAVAASCFALFAAIPAFAGPDFNAIEQAPKVKHSAAHTGQAESRGVLASQMVNCPPEKLVLLLDHGPRADTTPYLNRLRRERHASQMQACRDAGQRTK